MTWNHLTSPSSVQNLQCVFLSTPLLLLVVIVVGECSQCKLTNSVEVVLTCVHTHTPSPLLSVPAVDLETTSTAMMVTLLLLQVLEYYICVPSNFIVMFLYADLLLAQPTITVTSQSSDVMISSKVSTNFSTLKSL